MNTMSIPGEIRWRAQHYFRKGVTAVALRDYLVRLADEVEAELSRLRASALVEWPTCPECRLQPNLFNRTPNGWWAQCKCREVVADDPIAALQAFKEANK